jgi:WD40 repeat protein
MTDTTPHITPDSLSRLRKADTLGAPGWGPTEAAGSTMLLSYARDGGVLAALQVGRNSVLRWWGRESGSCVLPRTHASALAVSPDGRTAVCAGPRGLREVELHDGRPGRAVTLARGVNALCFGRDGGQFALAGSDLGGAAHLWLWDAREWRERRTLRADSGALMDVALSPDGRTVAACSADGQLLVWDAEDGTLRHAHRFFEHDIRCLAFHPSGDALALADNLGAIRVLELWTWTMRWMEGGGAAPSQVEFDPSGGLLAVGYGGAYVVRSAHDGRQLFAHEGTDDMHASNATFSPDGTELAWGEPDGTVGIWRPGERQA